MTTYRVVVDLDALSMPKGWVFDGVRRVYDDGWPLEKWIARSTFPNGLGSGSMALRTGEGSTIAEAVAELLVVLG